MGHNIFTDMKGILIAAFAVALVADGRAATINAASQADTAIQAAVNSASNGDTVVVPPGSLNWSGTGVTLDGTKGITIVGTGVTITRGSTTSLFFNVTTNATYPTRITGFTFNQTTNNEVITIGGGFTNAKFRVDNCTFFSTSGTTIFLIVYNSWGLIDHCTFTGDDASEMIHNQAWSQDDGNNGWVDSTADVDLVGNAVIVETNTFSKYNQADPYFYGTSAIQSYYGGRTIVRYNTFNYCQVDQHGGQAGIIGTRWWEIYENDFYCPANSNQSNVMAIRDGTGVIYNNRVHLGAGATTPIIEMFCDLTDTYPEPDQVGRGRNQVLQPAYCWGNTVTPVSGSFNVLDGRDFYSNTQLAGYAPYPYPDPLISITQGKTTPTTPSSLLAAPH